VLHWRSPATVRCGSGNVVRVLGFGAEEEEHRRIRAELMIVLAVPGRGGMTVRFSAKPRRRVARERAGLS
jgi:hypothetical protein